MLPFSINESTLHFLNVSIAAVGKRRDCFQWKTTVSGQCIKNLLHTKIPSFVQVENTSKVPKCMAINQKVLG